MKYILAKNTIIRKENLDNMRIFVYSSHTRKLCEISMLAQRILIKFKKPLDIDDILDNESLGINTRGEILKFMDKMIDNKYLEQYE